MTTLLLVHGGLWEAAMDADRFWRRPGIVAGLEKQGFDVLAPDRQHQDFPGAVAALLLAWPATAQDPAVDAHDRRHLAELGASDGVISALLGGQTLRGLTDEELAGLAIPVGVVPSAIANTFHQRRSVDGLLRLVPGAVGLPGCPESPRPEFPPYLESFVTAVAAFAEP